MKLKFNNSNTINFLNENGININFVDSKVRDLIKFTRFFTMTHISNVDEYDITEINNYTDSTFKYEPNKYDLDSMKYKSEYENMELKDIILDLLKDYRMVAFIVRARTRDNTVYKKDTLLSVDKIVVDFNDVIVKGRNCLNSIISYEYGICTDSPNTNPAKLLINFLNRYSPSILRDVPNYMIRTLSMREMTNLKYNGKYIFSDELIDLLIRKSEKDIKYLKDISNYTIRDNPSEKVILNMLNNIDERSVTIVDKVSMIENDKMAKLIIDTENYPKLSKFVMNNEFLSCIEKYSKSPSSSMIGIIYNLFGVININKFFELFECKNKEKYRIKIERAIFTHCNINFSYINMIRYNYEWVKENIDKFENLTVLGMSLKKTYTDNDSNLKFIIDKIDPKLNKFAYDQIYYSMDGDLYNFSNNLILLAEVMSPEEFDSIAKVISLKLNELMSNNRQIPIINPSNGARRLRDENYISILKYVFNLIDPDLNIRSINSRVKKLCDCGFGSYYTLVLPFITNKKIAKCVTEYSL